MHSGSFFAPVGAEKAHFALLWWIYLCANANFQMASRERKQVCLQNLIDVVDLIFL